MAEPARQKTPYLAASGSTVARELKEAREALGISVRDMAQTLRIRTAHIEALESGRFDELPGRPYTLGFARSIAQHVGLDPDDIAQRLRDEVMGTTPAVELVFPESTEDKRLSRAGWIVISLILAAGAYGGWLAVAHRDIPSEFAVVGPLPQTIPDIAAPEGRLTGTSSALPTEASPDAQTATSAETPPASANAESPGDAAAPPAPESSVAASESQEATSTPAGPDHDGAEAQAPASSPPQAASATPEAPAPTVPPAVASANPSAATSPAQDSEDQEDVRPEPTVVANTPPEPRVVLHADRDSWIQIQSSDGATVVARTLKAGESYAVPDQAGLKLTTGNAGGLIILVDGRAIAPLGQPGAVRRDVALDPARLKARTALQ